MTKFDLPALSRKLAVTANFMVLLYLIVYGVADPKPALVAAVAFEVGFFICLVGYRRWREGTTAAKKSTAALATIEEHSRFVYYVRRTLACVSCAALLTACVYMALDFTALVCVRYGQEQTGTAIYKAIAVAPSNEIHPALSLELLAGAYIDGQRFQHAEPLEFAVLQIRRELVGEQDELVAAMYANLGDFYRNWSRAEDAEKYYIKSIALTKQLHLRQGWGSPLTRLACLYRDTNRTDKAKAAFEEAIDVRSKIFGSQSMKVADTLEEYALLQAGTDPAGELQSRARVKLIRSNYKEPPTSQAIPYVVLIGSLLFFWQKDKILQRTADFLAARKAKNVKKTKDSDNVAMLTSNLKASPIPLSETAHS